MKFTQAASLVSLVALSTAAPALRSRQADDDVLGAAFFLSNDPSGNFVLASTIARSGALTTVRAVPTGGNGQHSDSSDGANSPDALFSQGAIKVGGNAVFAVNPGSNTVSMFNINPSDPANIQAVGKPQPSGGEFPVSVAANEAGTMVCALNGGKVNGVSCFKPDAKKGLTPIKNTTRSLGLNQTTPANGPAGSVSHVLFNQDGSQLVASVKGIPPNPGFLAVWTVEQDGSLSQTFNAITPPTGGLLPFGMAVIDGTSALMVTDAGIGFDVIDLNQDFSTAKGKKTGIQSAAAATVTAAGTSSANAVSGQKAVCWAAFSKQSGTFFLTDIGTDQITEVSVNPSTLKPTILMQYNQTAGTATIDDAVASIGGTDFLYVLGANATTIDVLSTREAKQAQPIESVTFAAAAKELGINLSPANVQGMTVFSSS